MTRDPGNAPGGGEYLRSGAAQTTPEALPDRASRSAWLWTALGTALGLSLLYASTRKVDRETLYVALQSTDPVWIVWVLTATFGFVAIKAWRWRLLLGFVPDLKFGKLHSAVYIGLAVNFLIAHVGEVLRAVIIARGSRVAVSAVFASVVIERALDFIAFLALSSLLLLLAVDAPAFVEAAAAITGGVVVLAMAGLYSLVRPPAWLRRLVAFGSRPIPATIRDWCLRQVEQSRRGLEAISNWRLMSAAVLLSITQWALIVLAVWASGSAVGVSVTLAATITTFVLLVIGLMLPNSPMQVGTTQLAFTMGLGTAGVSASAAIAASLIYTVFLIIPVMLVGGACSIRSRTLQQVKLR
jgi:uncharacterized protein (TIRG00374 family)